MKLLSSIVVICFIALVSISTPCDAETAKPNNNEALLAETGESLEDLLAETAQPTEALVPLPHNETLLHPEEHLSGHKEDSLRGGRGGAGKGKIIRKIIGGIVRIGVAISDKKECNQCAVWFSTPNQSCVSQAAQWIQDNFYQGEDGYIIENSGGNGGWVRYWRVGSGSFSQKQCGDVNGQSGSCNGGGRWSAGNAQPTKGKVYCKHQ